MWCVQGGVFVNLVFEPVIPPFLPIFFLFSNWFVPFASGVAELEDVLPPLATS